MELILLEGLKTFFQTQLVKMGRDHWQGLHPSLWYTTTKYLLKMQL